MMKKIISLIGLLLSGFAFAENIIINFDGKELAKVSMEDIKKMKSTNVEHFNKTIRRSELYVGVSTLSFIEKYFPEIQKINEVEFSTDNNINPFISMTRFQNFNSILAYDRADGDKFVRFSKKEKILVPLSPLYLVWDLKGASQEDKHTYKSLYQIRTINLISKKVNLGVNQDEVDTSVFLGYETYKEHCISCHAVGKVGGGNSFDLLKRKTLQNKGSEYVRKYIINPNLINPKTKMLPFSKVKGNEKMIQGIIDFLKFMENPNELLQKNKSAEGQTNYKALKNIVDKMH